MINRLSICIVALLSCIVPLFAGDLGDVNDDSSISIVDALLTAQYYVGMNVQIDLRAADVNYSETVDIVDALVIARYYVGIITRLNDIDYTPCNQAASRQAKKVLEYLARLSSPSFNGVITGQNCGHGSQIAEAGNTFVSYDSLVNQLHDASGKWIAILGEDYEHDRIYTPEQLAAANGVLVSHWNRGGLITINWSPHNPWTNNESDIYNSCGNWQDTRTSSPNYNPALVKLADLIDPAKPVYQVWRKKLDRIATALASLRDSGVVVLFRPMQEANGNWFWWGIASHPADPAPYVNLFRNIYDYFTKVKGLTNLLWVYSPAAGGNTDWLKPVDWLYPGANYVDVVAGTAYNDSLTIADYPTYVGLGKPIGMAELGCDSGGSYAKNGTFDNRKYLDTIRTNYPAIGYWVSWHNWDNGDGTQALMSISRNLYASELLNNTGAITLDKLDIAP